MHTRKACKGNGLDCNPLMQVVTPAPGGPADRAGLQAGDIIVAIDGKPTNGASLYDAGDMLQGAEGSEVNFRHAVVALLPIDPSGVCCMAPKLSTPSRQHLQLHDLWLLVCLR